MTFLRTLLALSITVTAFVACSPVADIAVLRDDTVKRTASPVFMLPRNIKTDPFHFLARERVYKNGQPATIYLEGDATTGQRPASSPSPESPIALRLAAQDKGQNVIWLHQPCQYFVHWKDGAGCPAQYYNGSHYAPEVIESYKAALDNIKAYYNIPSFDLVGYDGGAAIAVILASQRTDIKSIRTVAGNLDPQITAHVNGVPYVAGSLDPMDFSAGIANLPQRHFLGKNDMVTPPVVYNSFAQSVGNSQCMNVTIVDNADHVDGWVEQWAVLKDMPLDCAHNTVSMPVPFDPTPLDGDKYKRKHKAIK